MAPPADAVLRQASTSLQYPLRTKKALGWQPHAATIHLLLPRRPHRAERPEEQDEVLPLAATSKAAAKHYNPDRQELTRREGKAGQQAAQVQVGYPGSIGTEAQAEAGDYKMRAPSR